MRATTMRRWKTFFVFNDFARCKMGFARSPCGWSSVTHPMPIVSCFIWTNVRCSCCATPGRVRGLYNGNRRLAAPAEAREIGNLNRVLHWHSMRAYKPEGFRLYDWGGISQDQNDGRARFKKAFGGEVAEEYSYLHAGWPPLGFLMQTLLELTTARGLRVSSQ
jgi:hypothetical protein